MHKKRFDQEIIRK